jgi:ABC-2 type transport system permease protein
MTVTQTAAPATPLATWAESALAETGTLAKLALRRDRIMLPAWLYLIVIGVSSTAFTFGKLYKTPESRVALVTSGQSNPALVFLYGRLNGDSVGALTAWRYGVWGALFAVLMTIFIVIRHTRGDEEAGRLELIGSARVGRQAPLVAALSVAVLANVAVTVLLCAVLPLANLPAAGSAALALAIGTSGLAFTGISAVAAQLTSGARAARGLAIGMLGLSFLARAVGDAAGAGGPSWLTWALPLGWTEELRPFAQEQWWVLLLPLVVFAAGTWLAFVLSARRDHGAGLLPDRPGRPAGSELLRGPFALAWRLQWSSLFWWAAGYAFMFAVCGAAAKGIGQLFGSSSALQKEFTRLGGQAAIVDAFLAALMLLAGLVAAAYGISAVLRLHAEETGGRADPVLAGSAGRVRWGLSHLLVAVTGTAALLAIAGLATGLGYGIRAGGAGGEMARMLGAGLAQLPAALVLVGLAMLAFGVLPDACTAIGWTGLGLVVALNIFGQMLQLPNWIMNISPFTHAPRLPGGPVPVTSLALLSVLAVALCVAGLGGLRHRDVG